MNLSFLEIEQGCITAVQEANRRGDGDTFLLFDTLYKTGFRAAEVLNIKSWILRSDGSFFVPAHKGGNAKIVEDGVINEQIVRTFENGMEWEFEGSKTTYQRLFQNYSGLRNCWVGKKRITLHCFRHAYIKRSTAGGVSLNEINSALGIRRNATTMHYMYKTYQNERYNTENM